MYMRVGEFLGLDLVRLPKNAHGGVGLILVSLLSVT